MTETTGETLRERQARAVRDELRHAFVHLVAERGLDGFALVDVAAAAGVSERTLYRHYPSRDDLVRAIKEEDVAAMDRELLERAGPYDLDDPEALVHVYEVFERHTELMKVGRVLRLAGMDARASATRTEYVRRQFEGIVHPEALDQVVAISRALGGVDAWLRMREPDVDLDSRRAGHAVQWALQVLFREARTADGPLVPSSGGVGTDVVARDDRHTDGGRHDREGTDGDEDGEGSDGDRDD
jgi:AcrR family transcriptional regulator